MVEPRSFDFVESKIRKKTFGILSTISPKGYSQSTGILYGVSQEDPFRIYVYTHMSYKKAQNVQSNPRISFVIPFPHHWFRFIPSNTVAFQGRTEIIPFESEDPHLAFSTHRILRMMLEDEEADPDRVFIQITPNKRFHVYGVGIPLMKLRGDHEGGSYTVEIPAYRR